LRPRCCQECFAACFQISPPRDCLSGRYCGTVREWQEGPEWTRSGPRQFADIRCPEIFHLPETRSRPNGSYRPIAVLHRLLMYGVRILYTYPRERQVRTAGSGHYVALYIMADSGPWRSEERESANPTRAAGGAHKITPAWRFQRNNWLPVPSRTVPSASLHNSPSNTLIAFVQSARRRCAALVEGIFPTRSGRVDCAHGDPNTPHLRSPDRPGRNTHPGGRPLAAGHQQAAGPSRRLVADACSR